MSQPLNNKYILTQESRDFIIKISQAIMSNELEHDCRLFQMQPCATCANAWQAARELGADITILSKAIDTKDLENVLKSKL